jgi:hypothetical protein
VVGKGRKRDRVELCVNKGELRKHTLNRANKRDADHEKSLNINEKKELVIFHITNQ